MFAVLDFVQPVSGIYITHASINGVISDFGLYRCFATVCSVVQDGKDEDLQRRK